MHLRFQVLCRLYYRAASPKSFGSHIPVGPHIRVANAKRQQDQWPSRLAIPAQPINLHLAYVTVTPMQWRMRP